MREIKLSAIALQFKLSYFGKDVTINGLNLCNRKSIYESIISYVVNDKYIDFINSNKSIKCLVVSSDLLDFYSKGINREMAYLIHKEPESLFYTIHDYLYNNTDFYEKFYFKSSIGENCLIHPSAQIDCGVIIGNNVSIGPNTVIRSGSIISDDVYIGCNTTIGSEGFQIIKIYGNHKNVKHVGGVKIGKGTYIGDNCCVCNSLFETNSMIGQNTRVDNLVHIAHNVIIGNNVVLTAGVVLCGSTYIKDSVWVGVNTSVLNNVTLGESSLIGIGSVVLKDVPANKIAYGVPAKIKE
jgi:UDP-3-O-[3-hydroxymyristoyl] glucosamine N-acyltransferase